MRRVILEPLFFPFKVKDPHSRDASTSPCPNCMNPRTNKTFVIEDECDIKEFEDNCPSCPEMQCVFTM